MCHDVVGNVVCCAISFISMLYLTTSSCGSTHSLLPSRLCGGRQQANKTLVVACCDVHQKNALYVVCCVGVLEWHVFFFVEIMKMKRRCHNPRSHHMGVQRSSQIVQSSQNNKP